MIPQKNKGTVLSALCLLLMSWIGYVPVAAAQDVAGATQVMESYLAALVAGDTAQLATLIDGRMKQRNRQLELNPETYGAFLRRHYDGVRLTLEQVVAEGGKVRARVRFERPDQAATVIEFILERTGAGWKITDEIY